LRWQGRNTNEGQQEIIYVNGGKARKKPLEDDIGEWIMLCYNVMGWIDVAENRDRQGVLMNTVANLPVP
jgi:hypothetical protein